jgi:hypothetical protein
VTHVQAGFSVSISVSGRTQAPLTWIRTWIANYETRMVDEIQRSEASFFYLLATASGSSDGFVHKDGGVIEIGYGTSPAGPPDGIEVPLELVLRETRTMLESLG